MKNLLKNPEVLNNLLENYSNALEGNTITPTPSATGNFSGEVLHIFDLVNRSKNIGRNDLANKFFTLLFDPIRNYADENDIIFEIEKSYTCRDAYYDLLVVYTYSDHYETSQESVCIPVPLLTKQQLEIVIHTGFKTVDRNDRPHNREVKYDHEEETYLLSEYNKFFPEVELSLKEEGPNGLWEIFFELNKFVEDNFDILYIGGVRLGCHIEKDYYAPRRVQINSTRLHEFQSLKYAAGHKYSDDAAPTEEQLRQTVVDLQTLIDAASQTIPVPFSLKISENK